MKVVGFSSSPRKDGNTSILLKTVFAELESQGIETELIQMAGSKVHGCIACYGCFKTKDKKCVVKDDPMNDYIAKMVEADGIILGSPTYFADITPEMKCLIDRAGFVARANDYLLKYKAGAAVMSVRRGGAIHAFDTMNHFLHYMQMFLVGATYWNMVYGRDIGEVAKDDEGIQNMKVLGQNMAWLLKKIRS